MIVNDKLVMYMIPLITWFTSCRINSNFNTHVAPISRGRSSDPEYKCITIPIILIESMYNVIKVSQLYNVFTKPQRMFFEKDV